MTPSFFFFFFFSREVARPRETKRKDWHVGMPQAGAILPVFFLFFFFPGSCLGSDAVPLFVEAGSEVHPLGGLAVFQLR